MKAVKEFEFIKDLVLLAMGRGFAPVQREKRSSDILALAHLEQAEVLETQETTNHCDDEFNADQVLDRHEWLIVPDGDRSSKDVGRIARHEGAQLINRPVFHQLTTVTGQKEDCHIISTMWVINRLIQMSHLNFMICGE